MSSKFLNVKDPNTAPYRNTEKEEQLFKCVECDKLFTRKSNLKTHMKVTITVQRVKLSWSAKLPSISSFSDLFHSQNHYDGAKITCDVCNQQFLDRSNFNRHMNAKHPKDKSE